MVPPNQSAFPPLFFSYAHAHHDDFTEQQDADLWVRKFYGHLCAEVGRLADVPRGQDVLFIDRRITLGTSWPLALAENLSKCAVFVPLYTRTYFQRPDCGREWSVIRMRQDMHIADVKSYPSIVVPVLWESVRPQDMPVWAQDIQFAHEELGHAYQTYGLEELLRVKDHEAAYYRAVKFLARRIVSVARDPEQLRQLREIPDFHSLPDEFADHRARGSEGEKVRITVAALDTRSSLPLNRSRHWYGASALDWTPYREPDDGPGSDTPVAWRADDVARQRNYVPEITELTLRSEELDPDGVPTAPTLMLVDPWATLDADRRTLFGRLDRVTKSKPWIRIIMPWNPRDKETAANADELHRGLKARLGNTSSQGRIPPRRGEPGPVDGAAFGLAVSEALRVAFAEYLRRSEKHLPPGPYPSKPRLQGPVGRGAPLGHADLDGSPAPGRNH